MNNQPHIKPATSGNAVATIPSPPAGSETPSVSNELQAHDGTTFDLRNITAPIIVFTSIKDNISPPPQTLGWILDLYRDAEAIRASGRTIVYCVNQAIGHLALFVSSKVGAKEDEEFVQVMDIIDCLPPGLHEMLIEPRPAEMQTTGFITGDWTARFADTNPWTQALAGRVTADRSPVADDNPFLTLQTQFSAQITASLDAWGVTRDQLSEHMFFGLYGSPIMQALLGIQPDEAVRPLPADSHEQRQTRQQTADALAHKLRHGSFDEALTRAVLYASATERAIEQRAALALNVARQHVLHLSLREFKIMVREQFSLLQPEREQAIEAVADLVTEADARGALLQQVRKIVAAAGAPNPLESERLERLTTLLANNNSKRGAPVRARRTRSSLA